MKNSSLILGFFDGVHIAHQVVIKSGLSDNSVLVTFKNSPNLYFQGHVEYILSNDIKTTKSQNTKFIGANERLLVDDLEIRTLESSDLGVAFIVKVEDKIIYHAGDLNWWHWEGENTPEENKFAEDKFKSAIDKIKGENIDVAFLPLDSRQGNQYYLGFDYFMRNTNTKVAFPMHFFRAYSLSKIFKDSEYASTYKDKIIDINKDGQTFEL